MADRRRVSSAASDRCTNYSTENPGIFPWSDETTVFNLIIFLESVILFEENKQKKKRKDKDCDRPVRKDRTLELRLYTTLESYMTIQGVRPGVSVPTTRTRVTSGIVSPYIRGPIISLRRINVGHVQGWLEYDLVQVVAQLFLRSRELFVHGTADSRGTAVATFGHLILSHQTQVQGLVLIIPLDGRARRILAFQKTQKERQLNVFIFFF